MPEFTTLITANELADASERNDVVLLDCRFDLAAPGAGRAAYRQGHIPGAVYLDLDRDLAAPVEAHTGRHPLPPPAAAAATFELAGVGPVTQVVAYDAGSGAVAARAWWMLRWLGHTRVAVLDGGVAAWTAAGYPLVPAREDDIPSRAPLPFVPRVRAELVLGTPEIAAAVAARRPLTLVDARDEARFAGIREPIDAVAGHIPGAVNFPLGRSLRPDGHWRRPDELAAAWHDILGEAPNGPWAVMCGSGVTACHLALSGVLAGYREPRVYIGSWSEWIRDPRRPIATGPGPDVAEPAAT